MLRISMNRSLAVVLLVICHVVRYWTLPYHNTLSSRVCIKGIYTLTDYNGASVLYSTTKSLTNLLVFIVMSLVDGKYYISTILGYQDRIGGGKLYDDTLRYVSLVEQLEVMFYKTVFKEKY